MHRAKVRLSPRAQRWFLARVAEFAEVNPAAANNLIKRMELLVDRLAQFPEMTERGVIAGTRRAVLYPFIVTLRFRDDVVEIVAMRHARQGDARKPYEARES